MSRRFAFQFVADMYSRNSSDWGSLEKEREEEKQNKLQKLKDLFVLFEEHDRNGDDG